MSRLIIIFVILTIWAVINIVKASQRSGIGQIGKNGTNKKRKPSAGKKYSWTWMQTAGSMHLKFIRPEEANGYPAISGTVNGITVMVQCAPSTASAPESMVFRFLFPEPADIGLELKTAEDADGLREKSEPDQTGTAILADMLGKRPSGAYFMRVADPEIFRSCFGTENLEQLARLSLIYVKVMLTDSELRVRTAGINNDPQRFHEQLETLLNIASSFAGFARQSAERKKMTPLMPKHVAAEPVKQKNPGPEKTPEPVKQKNLQPEKTPEPVKQEIPPQEKTSDLPQDQSSFIRMLWSSGISTDRQKELFAPYVTHEVEWEGMLKMCYTFSSDFVFGKEDGVKATFELEEFKPEGSFMPIKVKAVAAFPRTESDKLSKASGKKFRFRGKLLKIEPIAREIYLSSGSITGVLS